MFRVVVAGVVAVVLVACNNGVVAVGVSVVGVVGVLLLLGLVVDRVS